MNLTLERRGEFAATAADDGSQCGPRGLRRFKYRVRITAPDWALDPATGFVVDHDAVQRYFDAAFAGLCAIPSCERMAVRAARDLTALVPRARRVAVTIAGSDHAHVTAVWP